jgi:pyridoxamine 5'-phosphate oxidase
MLIEKHHPLPEIFDYIETELKRATIDRKHPFRYCVLSTYGRAINSRYVVLRKVNKDLELMIYTDSRSKKVSDISINDQVQLLFYHPKRQVQVIVTGKAHLCINDELTSVEWQHVKGNAQRAYNTIEAPGTPISSPQAGHDFKEHMDEAYFTVIKIKAEQLEALQLNQSEHLRLKFNINDDWGGQWLVP